jgi:hypothetical protein
MAIGRITGPLLASNLRRDGVNLAFETDLLFLDVVNGRIGIRRDDPQYELDVTGTIRADELIVNTATIGLVTITSTTSSSTISSLFGDISVQPGGGDVFRIDSDTYVDGDVYATGNFFAQGDIKLGDTTSSDLISLLGRINSDVLPYVSTGTVVEEEIDGEIVETFVTNTSIVSDFSIGNTTTYWKNGYLENIYTKQIDTMGTETTVSFFPDIPRLERLLNKSVTINGDIRVYGGNPIGTFPIVNNILYVNENGDDDNDGRGMDSSRACRTITGATRSPYFKQGTIIKISPGYYLEDNPIKLLPYTSVVGDSLRGVFVEPLNNTVDLFHVNSGVYITGMTMLNLRRGEVTRFAPGGSGTYTTGAYCVAFPPSLDNPIELFHSPYIQNCTNQSGPWLYDGTMFVPNQTVQIPLVVANSTYDANTTTLTVSIVPRITAQMPAVGMAVNGKGILIEDDIPVATIDLIENADIRYQNAKRLLEINAEFIKEEVVSWVDENFVGFSYDRSVCKRDAGFILEALINDAILGGNRQIVEAGRAYYIGTNQILGNELVPTIAAFGRLKEAAIAVVSNIEFDKSDSNFITQTIREDLPDGNVVVSKINELVDLLIDILENNAGYENAAALLNANRGFIQAETVSFVNNTYVGHPIPSFAYDQEKCFRDVGLVIDAIATDLLFGGNEQTIAAGLAYQQGLAIPGEVDETLAAFKYLATIVRDVVLKFEVDDAYQSTVTQNTSLPVGTNAGVELLTRNIRLINKLIQEGAESAPAISANGPAPTTVEGIVNSYNLIIANKEFLQAEVVGYVNVTFTNLDFEYNEEKCARDTGLILDGLILDLVHEGSSQSTFAGLQYWSQGQSAIPGEEEMTVQAFEYAKTISRQIVLNELVGINQELFEQSIVTTATNSAVATTLEQKFDTIIDIIENGTEGVTDRIIPNGDITENQPTLYAVDSLQSNKNFIIEQVISFIDTTKPSNFEYDDAKCRRDVGYILDSVSMDILRGGNRQSIQAGVYYFGYDEEAPVLINEVPQTVAAYKFMKVIVDRVVRRVNVTKLYQTDVAQNTDLIGATEEESKQLQSNVDLIKEIIKKGPSVAPEQVPIRLAANTSTNVTRAYNILRANRAFIVSEVVNFVNTTFIQPFIFKYNEEKCFRDVGLIVDAIANDIIKRSNVQSLEAGLAYWDNAVSVINGQLRETAGAIQYAKNVALKVIANNPVTNFYQKSVEIQVPGSTETRFSSVVPQIINPQLNGGDVARDLVDKNFNAITTIIEKGPAYTPFSTDSTVTDFVIHLSTSTIASAVDDTMYFGYTTVYPEEDRKIPGEWGHNGFADRRIDPNGSGGGALVDGNAPSLKSPIQSFVFDAFTQITQGGRGIHIINEGYAQLVSVFTIFCNVAVETDTGGIASITNSNNNFGDICLMSRGFGKRKFGGTIYNPAFTAFNQNTNSFEPNEFYPQGYFPERQTIAVFVPNPDNRPGISLVMEVVPPDEYVNFDGVTVPYRNEQGYPGFLTAIVNTGTLSTGSFTISGINTDGVAVGQTIFIKDQFGYEASNNGEGEPYVQEGTVVAAVDYKTITLNKPINEGGGEQFNPFYFNIYSCGNAYYNILSSSRANSPYPIGQSKILGQETETIDAINFLRDTAVKVVTNTLVENTYTSAISQVIDTSLPGGNNAVPVIQSNLGIITNVILSGPQAAPAPTTTGAKVPFNENSAQLLEKNKLFLMNEVVGYVDNTFGGFIYDQDKCKRDTGLIIDSIAFDLLYEGTTQSTFAGLQYWNQDDYVDAIGSQITTTTNAIQYAKTLSVSVAQSAGGSGPATLVGLRFDDILNILNNGTVGVTNLIVPNGEKTLDSSILSAVNGLQSNKENIQDQTISWINSNNPGFDYDEEKCRRDIGYIIDSVSFDIMHGGNRQSIMSGVYYYGFNPAETSIPGEIPQTTAAYNFIKAIIGDIITGTPISPKFQDEVSQITNLTPGTRTEDLSAQEKINVITSIINQGPAAAPERQPISLTASTSSSVTNAFKIILANREFIKAEVIAYIDYEFGGFNYNRQKCRRDVGLMIDALVADLRSGGNFRSVEAAKTYYSREGTYHIVTVEDNVRNPLLFIDGSTVNFYQRSYQSASGYLFEYVGAGTQYGALPQVGRVDPEQGKEVVQLNNGKVFFTSTDQNGDFRIGPTLVISQATGVLSGRTFEKSLFAQMTPFILAVESGGGE